MSDQASLFGAASPDRDRTRRVVVREHVRTIRSTQEQVAVPSYERTVPPKAPFDLAAADRHFRASVVVVGECWVWTGQRNSGGHGIFRHRGGTWMAHRWAWAMANGEIPDGLQALHHCDNPPCVNPAHLYVGTHADNMRDRNQRGRQARLRGEANGNARLADEHLAEIRRRYAAGGVTLKRLATEFDVSYQTIWRVVKGRRATAAESSMPARDAQPSSRSLAR